MAKKVREPNWETLRGNFFGEAIPLKIWEARRYGFNGKVSYWEQSSLSVACQWDFSGGSRFWS